MAEVINQARLKQRSLVITLLDLKNAFGEVHHNLIQEVLNYHHIPEHIKYLIRSLYTDFKTSILTYDFHTPFITVGRGILQGDCLSPLLFNLCFNTFIQHIKSEKFRQCGVYNKSIVNGTLFSLRPIHWFQFADDAAVISGQENENQVLLNRFTLWCQWADMIIRVDKCITFGVKKATTKSIQYQPKLFIKNQLIPRVDNGNSFKYLGRYFDFGMTNSMHKSKLTAELNKILSQIDLLPLHPKYKILLYSRHLLSKISWHFTVADLTKTWVSENLDNTVASYIRRWLEIPICGTLSNIFLTKTKFGLNIYPPSTKFVQCQTVARNVLKSSPNKAIQTLWKSTRISTNLQYDSYKDTKQVLKAFRSDQENRLKSQLVSQGSFFSSVTSHSLPKFNSIWSSAQSNLPKNIFNFTVRYINNTLPTRKNLSKWGLSSSPDCSFCLMPESLLHIVAGCSTYLNEGRYTWRHNSVLQFIASTFQTIKGASLFADLPGFVTPSVITGDSLRPDLLLEVHNKCLYILELTIGYETNLTSNIARKDRKYQDLIRTLKCQYNNVKVINLSVSTLGVLSSHSTDLLLCLENFL